MNKIVREHYPVENLPEDLREGLQPGATVRVVVEVDDAGIERQPMSFEESMRLINDYRRDHPERVSVDDAVRRIRDLRDEWDER
ncbi:hypothetical protein SAMN05880590_111116 [Rhizobium sp. RU35A]|uniref:siderophore-interacting protein n=1 Tax=Rhizobium sp. RU35A TaxID=1907414 RepID=UPI000953C1C9|nr:siderophore-interacting protein [Rhizobium sp. RU35A]SIR07092.1 hypothetical protein SAMN05880590_111116 [Rhizobium sp. RU35A]